jgi:hypothetical protein
MFQEEYYLGPAYRRRRNTTVSTGRMYEYDSASQALAGEFGDQSPKDV